MAPHSIIELMRDVASGNSLLRLLDDITLRELDATPLEVRSGEVLQQSGAPETYAFFPISAVLSMVSRLSDGASVEVATVGHEGMAGLSDLVAAYDSPTENIVQIGGTCVRARTAVIRSMRDTSPALRAALDRYITGRLIQVTQIAACHRLHPIGARLPRWLLGLHDRAGTAMFGMTQQMMADMLGVHRPTIAAELQRLDASRAIKYRGRRIAIVDRARLEALACECHAALHREFVRHCADPGASPGPRRETTAHELRSQLHVILGWCALGRREGASADALAIIERNARAQLALINDVLGD